MKIEAQLKEAWRNNQQMNLRLLRALDEESLAIRGPKGRTRNVRANWIHLHHTRLNWIGAMMENPPKVERLKGRDKLKTADILEGLEASSAGIERLLEELANQMPAAPFKGSVTAFLGMMLAHEAHHRAHILLLIRNAGKALPRTVRDSLWDFGEDL